MREIVPPPSYNTVEVCDQITCLILYCISSRLVTLLKVIDAPKQVSDIFYLTVSFKFINLSFQIFLRFVPAMSGSFTSYIVWIIYIVWFVSFNHCTSACFLWSKKITHSSSNHGLCCLNSCGPRLYLVEILILSLMFSKPLFMSSLSLKFSKAADVFEILIWYCFLTPSSSGFLRLNLSTSGFCAACLLTANLSLSFATTR